MAAVSQGTTVSWAGVALGELISVSVDGVEVDTVETTPKSSTSRYKTFSAGDIDAGTVSVTCRGTAAATTTCVGLTGTLAIAGPSVAFNWNVAVYRKLAWSASLDSFQVYQIAFKISGG